LDSGKECEGTVQEMADINPEQHPGYMVHLAIRGHKSAPQDWDYYIVVSEIACIEWHE